MNYSKVKSVISCWGSELTSSCKRKGTSVSCWLRKLRSRIMSTGRHTAMYCLSPNLTFPPLSPSAFHPAGLSSCCCCIINLACLKLIVLYLTSQSIARIPLLVPRVFSKSGTNNKSFASSLAKYFYYFISPGDRVWESRVSKTSLVLLKIFVF